MTDNPKRKLAAIMFTDMVGYYSPRQTDVGQAPLREGWILFRLFGTKDGVCKEYRYYPSIVLTIRKLDDQ